MQTFLRIVRAIIAFFFVVTLLVSWLVSPGPEQGRRPEPWPDTRVPVRYTWGEGTTSATPDGDAGSAGSTGTTAPRAPDQADVLMQDNEPSEWSSGTAFAVEQLGVLVTAAHVTNGCSQLAIAPEGDRREYEFASEIVQHTRADVAVVRMPHAAPPLPLGDDALVERGATGFGFGYPSGEPSAVVGELMGRARGRGEHDYDWWPVMVWALVAREPDSEASLGGISGGPLLDAGGRVIGVVIAAGSERRPRFVTTTIAPVLQALQGAVQRIPSDPGTRAALTAAVAAEYGRTLRARGTVASAICRRADVGRRGR